jgi:hypothetical protein
MLPPGISGAAPNTAAPFKNLRRLNSSLEVFEISEFELSEVDLSELKPPS